MLRTLSLLACCLTPSASFASPLAITDWYVDDDAVGPGTGTLGDPFQTIQAGIDAAATLDGDTLRVLPGTYEESVIMDGKAVNVRGELPLGSVVLRRASADDTSLLIQNLGGLSVDVTGLTFNGLATVGPVNGAGCGVDIVGADVSIEDCSLVRFGSGPSAAAVRVDGASTVTIDGCEISDNRGAQFAAGLLARAGDITIRDSRFERNSENAWSAEGAAIYSEASALEVTGCTFTGNNALYGSCAKVSGLNNRFEDCEFIENGDGFNNLQGGALHGIGAATGCVFERNRAERGGALYGRWTVADSDFVGNGGADTGEYGTAVFSTGPSAMTDCVVRQHYGVDSSASSDSSAVIGAILLRCTFEDNLVFMNSSANRPQGGAAIHSCVATECVFRGNRAVGAMGADTPRGGAALDSILERCVFIGNSATEGGAVYRSTLTNCTMVHNEAALGGAAVESSLNGCIAYDSGPSPVIDQNGSAIYSCIEGGHPGTGNISARPMFVGPQSGDVHLLASSPCIDAADPSFTDPDGSRADMGAYPFDAGYIGSPRSFCAPGAADGMGCLPALSAGTNPSLGSGFTVTANGMGGTSLSIVFLGFQPAAMPYLNGTLCLGGSLRRGPLGTPAGGMGSCDRRIEYSVSAAQLSQAGFAPGSRLYAQVLYRDSVGGAAGVAITDALESIVQ